MRNIPHAPSVQMQSNLYSYLIIVVPEDHFSSDEEDNEDKDIRISRIFLDYLIIREDV